MSPTDTQRPDHVDLDHVPSGEGRRLSYRLEIDAEPEAVWEALTDADELARWFPFQARVIPGAGGGIWMSWDGNWEHENRISIWEPPTRLGTNWMEGPGATPLAVDYHLEGEGGRTVLRLVHHGFGADEDWDETYDSIRRGWSFELRCLRHYLENHRGRDRRVVTAAVPLPEGMAVEAAWRRFFSPAGLGLEGDPTAVGPEDRLRLRTVSGDTFEGRVCFWDTPQEASIRVDGWNDAILRAMIERTGPDAGLAATVWLETWGVAEVETSDLQGRWRRDLAGLFG